MKQKDEDTIWEIGDDQSQNNTESMMSSDIEEDDLDYHYVVQHLCQTQQNNVLKTTWVP